MIYAEPGHLKDRLNIHWFRRDLRLDDNRALDEGLRQSGSVLGLFIFDDQILKNLSADDSRVSFIYDSLKEMDRELKERGSSLLIARGSVEEVWRELMSRLSIAAVYANEDYEPYAL